MEKNGKKYIVVDADTGEIVGSQQYPPPFPATPYRSVPKGTYGIGKKGRVRNWFRSDGVQSLFFHRAIVFSWAFANLLKIKFIESAEIWARLFNFAGRLFVGFCIFAFCYGVSDEAKHYQNGFQLGMEILLLSVITFVGFYFL